MESGKDVAVLVDPRLRSRPSPLPQSPGPSQTQPVTMEFPVTSHQFFSTPHPPRLPCDYSRFPGAFSSMPSHLYSSHPHVMSPGNVSSNRLQDFTIRAPTRWMPHPIATPPLQIPFPSNLTRPGQQFHPATHPRLQSPPRPVILSPRGRIPPTRVEFQPGMRMEFQPGMRMELYPGIHPQPSYQTGIGLVSHNPTLRGGLDAQRYLPVDPFIEEWKKKSYNPELQHSNVHSLEQNMKIPEVRSLLMKGVELLSLLRSSHQALNSVPLGDSAEWERLKVKADLHKEHFLSIRASLDVPGCREQLVKKINRIYSRRARARKQWRERKEEWFRKVKGSELLTDQWVTKKEQEELKAKMEKSVQASASGVLEEVKRKMTEVKRFLEFAETLKELRSLRREGRNKGDAPPIEADEKFYQTHKALVDMLTQQLGVYEREEHALRVLMEEEVREKLHSHEKKAAKSKQASILPSSLASSNGSSTSLEPYQQFYRQAMESQDNLEAIRSEWDMFLSSEGSALPTSPELEAPPPSNPAWENYLHHE